MVSRGGKWERQGWLKQGVLPASLARLMAKQILIAENETRLHGTGKRVTCERELTVLGAKEGQQERGREERVERKKRAQPHVSV